MRSNACNNFRPAPLTRREMLQQAATGFGAMALTALTAEYTRAATTTPITASIRNPQSAIGNLHQPHFPPKARNVIFLYMDGGVSAMDSFDPKPLLTKEHG